MIIFLKEDTDKALTNHIPWHLPDGIRSHLESIRDNNDKNKLTKNHTTKEAWDHLVDILDMDNNKGIDIKEMKRIKNWFDKHTNATETTQYELYGGEIMMNWVNNQLTSARRVIKQQKEAEKSMGKENAFKKTHDTDRQTAVTKLNNIPTHNPSTGNKNDRLKELTALKENKTIILTEEQRNLASKLFIKK